MCLGAVGMKDEEKKAPVGFHSLTEKITFQPSFVRRKNIVDQQ